MRTRATLLAVLLLSGAASAQIRTPVIPSDAAARSRTPEQQAILDGSTGELAREMQLLGIKELRPPKNAVHPGRPDFANYDEAEANPWPDLPPLLLMNDGTRVTSPAQWKKRRAQIKALFDEDVYGKYPAHIPTVTWKVESVTAKTVDGVPAIVKHIVGKVDNSADPAITVEIPADVVTPASTKGRKVPVIMGGGALSPRFSLNGLDPILHIPGSEMCIVLGPQTDTSGKQLLDRGWGFVSVDVNAVQADNGAGLAKGIIGLVNKGQPRSLDDWGVLRAWAWANSRVLDYLQTDVDVNGKRVGIMGHSRGGKAALVALVDDPRFAIGFISSSGEGGANLYRRNYGEALENVAAPNEFHWMAGNFLKYAAVGKTANDLPVDSHEFIALAAPRPLFIGGGGYIDDPPCALPGDAWQDARGMFMAAAAASPAWAFYGRKGLETAQFPKMETFLDKGDIAYRQHPYGHTPTPNWSYFISFASRYLK
jgi:Chlorophyllase